MKWPFLFLSIFMTLPVVGETLTMSTMDAMQLAGNLVERGDLSHAEQILNNMPPMADVALETERSFLRGQIAMARGDYDMAAKIYRDLLDMYPDLARVRYELARVYMYQKKWHRADYHLRLAMAGRELPNDVKNTMSYMRYLVRQNKNWNTWFNIGAAPDNNINNATGGTECVDTMFGPMCRELADPESAVGINVALGGDYEFKIDKNWRWKNSGTLYLNKYNLREYDDLYIGASTGPRYVYEHGSVWLSGVFARRYYGWDPYMYKYGVRIDTDYDFTRRLSLNASIEYANNKYDQYSSVMNSDGYYGNLALIYSIDASKYIVMRGGVSREIAHADAYSLWRPGFGIGFGAELPYGFSFYAEPYFYWTAYDAARWVVYDGRFSKITEHDFTHRYSVRISNNKLDIWGFVPTITYSYTQRDSNVWQREFKKHSIEFTMMQRF